MPQTPWYCQSIEMSFRLFRLLNTLSLPNFVTPVSMAKRMYPSQVFKAP